MPSFPRHAARQAFPLLALIVAPIGCGPPGIADGIPDPAAAPATASVRARADSLVGEEQYEASVQLYRSIVEAWPDSIGLAYRLGQVLRATGRTEESLTYFTAAREAGYRVTSALYNTALARAALGDMDGAFATLDTMMAAGFRNKYGLLTDDELDPLRLDPRWAGFISEVWGTRPEVSLSQPLGRFQVRQDVDIPMRDGTRLRATVMIPDGPGPFPTVLARTPYGRVLEWGNRVHWAARGYALVAQDTRGRGDSEGAFDPWMAETDDGFDTIEWITQQPWSDGRVGTIGASYTAQTQWLAAASGHPALVAMIPFVSGTDPFFDTPWDHGILKTGLLPWVYSADTGEDFEEAPDWASASAAPLADADLHALGTDLPTWNAWVRRDSAPAWAQASFLGRLADRARADPGRLPAVLHVSGWWDVESIATQRNWDAMQRAGAGEQWLLYGPWEHQNFYEPPPGARGEVEFGDRATLPFIAEWTRFFDETLGGRRVGMDTVPRVRAFVIGEDRWVTGNRWPLETSVRREFVLSGRGGTSGILSEDAGRGGSARSYVFDPSAVPIQADPTFARSTVYEAGAMDAADQVAFLTSPLSAPLALVGPVEIELTVTTSAEDIDLYAFLVDVDAAGEARAMTHPGKRRASFRAGWDGRRPVRPGQPFTLTIPMFPVGYSVREGHRLGVVIRSDWFPRFAPLEAEREVAVTIGASPDARSVLRVWSVPSRSPAP